MEYFVNILKILHQSDASYMRFIENDDYDEVFINNTIEIHDKLCQEIVRNKILFKSNIFLQSKLMDNDTKRILDLGLTNICFNSKSTYGTRITCLFKTHFLENIKQSLKLYDIDLKYIKLKVTINFFSKNQYLFKKIQKEKKKSGIQRFNYNIMQNKNTLCKNISIIVIGQFNNEFIICSKNNMLLIIDQHAAHERIRYKALLAENSVQRNRQFQSVERLKTKACRGAIKFGKPLIHEHMKSLIHALFKCNSPLICGHGRPSILYYSLP